MNVAAKSGSAPKGSNFWSKYNTTASRSSSIYIASPEDFRGSFFAVLNRWRNETMLLSDPTKIMGHPSFAALVKNAEVVIPEICEQLRSQPSNIVWILEECFGFDPYIDGDEGDVEKQSNRWLDYLKSNG